MLPALFIVHLLSLAAGAGASLASGIVAPYAAAATRESREQLWSIQTKLSRVGAAAIVLLWITGLWMLYAKFGGFAGLPATFHVKLAFVVLITLAIGALHVQMARSKRTGVPPAPALMAALGIGIDVSLVLAVIFAVLTFGA
jgi:uncharacterized membrane protein